LLSDFGADVIEVRTNARPVDRFGAFLPIDPESVASYNSVSRNRRSVTLNLTEPGARDLCLRLVDWADIVLENFQPGVMHKFGLDADILLDRNPRLIMVSLSAAGQFGSWADAVTYGPSLTALYGQKSLLGYDEEGEPQEDAGEADPLFSGYALLPILGALRLRRSSGHGMYIDMAEGEAVLATLAEPLLELQLHGAVSAPIGNRHRLKAPRDLFPCKGEDSWIAIAIGEDEHWNALCRVAGHPEWATDKRFADAEQRDRYHRAVYEAISAWTRQLDGYRLTEELQSVGIPAYPVLDVIGTLSDPHLTARRADVRVDAPDIEAGQIIYGIPWKLHRTPGSIRRPTPEYGMHNQEVYCETLGLSKTEFADMVARRVIY